MSRPRADNRELESSRKSRKRSTKRPKKSRGKRLRCSRPKDRLPSRRRERRKSKKDNVFLTMRGSRENSTNRRSEMSKTRRET